MSAFYCLANTTVLGELFINANTETYSATSTAFSSGTTMKDAEKAATTASNSAAISATRTVVDGILTKYSTIYSDNVINSIISNSLKTDIHPIIPIALKNIATTSDGSNFSVDKNVNLVKYQMISVLDGETLTVPRNYTLNGPGIVRIGGTTAAKKSIGTAKSTSTCTASTNIQISGAYSNTTDISPSVNTCYNVNGPADPSDETPVVVAYTNYANLTSSGIVTFANVVYKTSCFDTNGRLITDGSTLTKVNLGTTASPSLFYISPYFPSVEVDGVNTFSYDSASGYYTVVLTNPYDPSTYESYSSQLSFIKAVKNVQFTIVGGGGGGGDTDSKCRGQSGNGGSPGGGGAGGSIVIIQAASYAADTLFAVTIAGGGKRTYQGHSSTVQLSGSSTIWTAVGGNPGESCLYNYDSDSCCSHYTTGGVGSGGGGSGGDADDNGSSGTNTTIYYNPNSETIPTTSSYYFGGGGAGGQIDGSNLQILGGLGGGQGGWATSTSNNIKGNKGEAYTGPNGISYAAGAYFESGYPSTGGGGAGGSGNTGEGLYDGWVGGTGVVICTYQVA